MPASGERGAPEAGASDAVASDAGTQGADTQGADTPAPAWRATGWRWGLVLAAFQVPIAAFLLAANYPGRANVDIRNQAEQALGSVPFADWHPPAMSLLWRILHQLTGQLGSLFVLQVLGLCVAAWLLCRTIGALGGGRLATLCGAFLPLAPPVLSQIGVLWKDTQMGVAFLLAMLLVLRIDARKPRTWWWLLPAGLFLLYGTMVRKNALAAVPPLLAVIAWQGLLAWKASGRRPRLTLRRPLLAGTAATLVACVLVAGLSILGDKAVSKVTHVHATGANLQVMLDDVLFTIPPTELAKQDLPGDYKAHLLKAQALCQQKGSRSDAYWRCYGKGIGGKNFSPLDHQAELKALWLREIPSHPGRYVAYRNSTYAHFMTTSVLVWWETAWQGDARAVGLGNSAGPADDAARWWVLDVWQRHVGVIYLPLFWLVAAVVGLVAARWLGRAKTLMLVASGSALLYLLAYYPVIPAPHFRYTWWPALAITAAWTLAAALGASHLARRRRFRRDALHGPASGTGVNPPQESAAHA